MKITFHCDRHRDLYDKLVYLVKNGRRNNEYDAFEKEYGLEMEIVSNQLRIEEKTDLALKENGMLLKKIEDLQRKLDSVKITFP